jgi:hypothetical protein
MKHKSALDRHYLDAEAAKDLELDEQPKPVRKVELPVVLNAESTTVATHKKIKGQRKIR